MVGTEIRRNEEMKKRRNVETEKRRLKSSLCGTMGHQPLPKKERLNQTHLLVVCRQMDFTFSPAKNPAKYSTNFTNLRSLKSHPKFGGNFGGILA